MSGDIDQISSVLGELTAEVRNLNRNVSALFKKFEEHAREDSETLNTVMLQGQRLEQVEHDANSLKVRVNAHEALKQRVIGWGIGSAACISGVGALIEHFWNK